MGGEKLCEVRCTGMEYEKPGPLRDDSVFSFHDGVWLTCVASEGSCDWPGRILAEEVGVTTGSSWDGVNASSELGG